MEVKNRLTKIQKAGVLVSTMVVNFDILGGFRIVHDIKAYYAKIPRSPCHLLAFGLDTPVQ